MRTSIWLLAASIFYTASEPDTVSPVQAVLIVLFIVGLVLAVIGDSEEIRAMRQ